MGQQFLKILTKIMRYALPENPGFDPPSATAFQYRSQPSVYYIQCRSNRGRSGVQVIEASCCCCLFVVRVNVGSGD